MIDLDLLAMRLLRWRYKAATMYEIPVEIVEVELPLARAEAESIIKIFKLGIEVE